MKGPGNDSRSVALESDNEDRETEKQSCFLSIKKNRDEKTLAHENFKFLRNRSIRILRMSRFILREMNKRVRSRNGTKRASETNLFSVVAEWKKQRFLCKYHALARCECSLQVIP